MDLNALEHLENFFDSLISSNKTASGQENNQRQNQVKVEIQKATLTLLNRLYLENQDKTDPMRNMDFFKKVVVNLNQYFLESPLESDEFISNILENVSPWLYCSPEELKNFVTIAAQNHWILSYQKLLKDVHRPIDWEEKIAYNSELPRLHFLADLGKIDFIQATIDAQADIQKLDEKGFVFLTHLDTANALNFFLKEEKISQLLPLLIENWVKKRQVKNLDIKMKVAASHALEKDPENWATLFTPFLKKMQTHLSEMLFNCLSGIEKELSHVWKTPSEISPHSDWPFTTFLCHQFLEQCVDLPSKNLVELSRILVHQESFSCIQKQAQILLNNPSPEWVWKTPEEEELSYGVFPFLVAFSSKTPTYRDSKMSNRKRELLNNLMGGDPDRFWKDALKTFDNLNSLFKSYVLSHLLIFFNDVDFKKINGFEKVKSQWFEKLEEWVKDNHACFISNKEWMVDIWIDLIKKNASWLIEKIKQSPSEFNFNFLLIIEQFKQKHINQKKVVDLITAIDEAQLQLNWTDKEKEQIIKEITVISKSKDKSAVLEAFYLRQTLQTSNTSKNKMRL